MLPNQSLDSDYRIRISTQDLTDISNKLMPTTGTTTYRSIGSNVSGVIKASSGSILSITATNLDPTTILYLQFFNKTTSPATNEVPFDLYPIYGSSGFIVLGQDVFGGEGMLFSTGITFGFSSTALTYTAVDLANKLVLTVRYK